MNKQSERPRRFPVLRWLVATALLFAACGGIAGEAEPGVALTITTGVGEDFKPVDSVQEISHKAHNVFIYMQWRNLPVGKKWLICTEPLPVIYKTDVYDGANKLVSSDTHRFTATKSDAISWLQHDFDPAEESPGTWRVEQHAYGKVIKASFTVTP